MVTRSNLRSTLGTPPPPATQEDPLPMGTVRLLSIYTCAHRCSPKIAFGSSSRFIYPIRPQSPRHDSLKLAELALGAPGRPV